MNNINPTNYLNRGSPFSQRMSPNVESPMKLLLKNKSLHSQHKGNLFVNR